MRIYIFLGVVFLMAAGCRTSRKVVQPLPVVDSAAISKAISDSLELVKLRADSAIRTQDLFKRVLAQRLDFETFSAKVKVDYRDTRDKVLDFNAFIRIRRDSAIWLSIVAALGVEAFRVIITPDSVRIMDKLEKTVQYAALYELQEITKLAFDFKSIQELIVGNPIEMGGSLTGFREEGTSMFFTLEGDGIRHYLTYDTAGLALRTSRLDDAKATQHRVAILSFDQYQGVGTRRFANQRRMTLSDRQKVDLVLDFRQVEFNAPVAFPFSVPRNYKLK